jgi:F0F1-type ATP synthase assembly protein I
MPDDRPRPSGGQNPTIASEDDERSSSMPGISDFLTMGLASAICLVVGGGAGVAIDASSRSSPLWTFVGLGIGLVAAVLVTVSQARKNL